MAPATDTSFIQFPSCLSLRHTLPGPWRSVSLTCRRLEPDAGPQVPRWVCVRGSKTRPPHVEGLCGQC